MSPDSTMPKEDTKLPDWSKLSGIVISSASHALAEVKQMSNQVVSPPGVHLPDWSKVSGAVLSRASDALAEVKQLSDQAISKKDDINLPNIDWSKVSGDIISHGSDALTGAKQLVNQVSAYGHWSSDMPAFQQYQEKAWQLIGMISNPFGVHWIKVWGTILAGTSNLRDNILSGVSKLWGVIPSDPFRLWRFILSKLWGTARVPIPLSTSNSNLCTALSCVSYALIGVNAWSIRHPYFAAAVLLSISGDPDILLGPLQLTGKPAPYTRTSTDPDYYETTITSKYENVDTRKAESTVVLSVSWLTGLGAMFVLGRTWGWWD
ncbi:hypothetical protein EV424DRAFT_1423398 [Suillus variegatus]|nr:hypothetical protein EV424DRAFT_1423398 [Suillus variegatus]